MWQAHKGYFQEDGRFVADDRRLIKIPINRLITIIWDEASDRNNQREAQRTAFEKFFAANQALNEQGLEPLDEEFDAIMAEGINL
jgi:hypothetical protein